MQRYFSHICDGTDVQADWRSCTYGRSPNAIDISQGSLTCPSYSDTGTLYGQSQSIQSCHLLSPTTTVQVRSSSLSLSYLHVVVPPIWQSRVVLDHCAKSLPTDDCGPYGPYGLCTLTYCLQYWLVLVYHTIASLLQNQNLIGHTLLLSLWGSPSMHPDRPRDLWFSQSRCLNDFDNQGDVFYTLTLGTHWHWTSTSIWHYVVLT